MLHKQNSVNQHLCLQSEESGLLTREKKICDRTKYGTADVILIFIITRRFCVKIHEFPEEFKLWQMKMERLDSVNQEKESI